MRIDRAGAGMFAFAVLLVVPLRSEMPELSNPPETVANVSREFWTPKPAAARKTSAARTQ